MMERLVEMRDLPDPDQAEAARLLASLPPVAPGEIAERRVYARVCAQPQARPRLVRAVVFLTVLLVSATVISATLAWRWFHHPDAAPVHASAATVQTDHRRPGLRPAALAPSAIVPEQPAAAEQTASTEEPSAAPASEPGNRPGRPALAKRRTSVLGGASDSRAATETPATIESGVASAPAEEAELVLAALRALRREHNPAQAGLLLERYLTRFPQGVLTQEALAIGMEAALARQDATGAAKLAEQYLSRYPAGRFVRLAHKASGTSKP